MDIGVSNLIIEHIFEDVFSTKITFSIAFETVTETLPIVLGELECEENAEICKLPTYSKEIKTLLPWLENRGYFEVA